MTFEILNFKASGVEGTLLATADICLDGKITVCDAKLVRRKKDKAVFLALPSRKVGTDYRPQVLIINRKLREEIEAEFANLLKKSDLWDGRRDTLKLQKPTQ